MNDRTLTSNERLVTLISFAKACSKPWIAVDVVATLKELQERRVADAQTAELRRDLADARELIANAIGGAHETPEYRKWPGEPPHCMSCSCGMTDEQKRTVPEADYLRIHRELMDLKYPGGRPSEKALEPHPLMTPLPADEAATLREVIGEAPQRGPRLGDPHPPSCACWECCK